MMKWIPLLFLVPLYVLEGQAKAFVLVAMIFCMSGPILADFLMENLPFLRFDGPKIISAWLDLRSRSIENHGLITFPVFIAFALSFLGIDKAPNFETDWIGALCWIIGVLWFFGLGIQVGRRMTEFWRNSDSLTVILNCIADVWLDENRSSSS